MRQAALLASVAAMFAAWLTDPIVAGQDAKDGSHFIAFRLDDTHAIATIKVTDTGAPQVTESLSPEPPARYGFRYFDLPAAWRELVPNGIREGERWLLHTSPGRIVQADAERIVGGQLTCSDAIGVLLRIAPEHVAAFNAVREKYFLSERSTASPSTEPERSAVRTVLSPSGSEFLQKLESTLTDFLSRELPGVRTEAGADAARMASSSVGYQRSWAERQRAMEDAMDRGEATLTYEIQSFHLSPDGVPVHFVRAEWKVRGRQGFAASLWLRGDQSLEILESDLRPASWLRM